MFGNLQKFEQTGHTVRLTFEQNRAEVDVIAPDIVHFFAPQKDEHRLSKAVENPPASNTDFHVEDADGLVVITTSKLRVEISRDFHIDIFDTQGRAVCRDYQGEPEPFIRYGGSATGKSFVSAEGHEEAGKNAPMKVSVYKQLDGDTHFYGLGEKTGPLNKKGYHYRMWNTDNPLPHTENFDTLYKSIPFLIALHGETAYGIFFDNTYESYFDMGRDNSAYYYFGAKDGNLDYYFIYGPSLKSVVSGYTSLTGRTPLPQLWALGYQQCRWSYAPKERLLEVAERFRKEHIPCDVLYLDIDYMDGYRVFTYDRERFSDFKGMIRKLKDDGFKVVTIIDPGVKKDAGYAVYEEGLKNGYFITDPDGIPYVNAVWPGDALFPDFSNAKVRAWWADKQQFLIENGVAGVWNDMNEPASFHGPLPDDVQFHNDGYRTDHAEMHNVYGHYMARSAFEGFRKHSDKRPFVITRACYAGTQKYSTIWTGDNQSLWEHLRMSIPQLLNLGLSGFAYAGCDVGGFGFDCTPELLSRWVQVGCFTPLFRNHSSYETRSQEPWAFDEQTKAINQKYIELRYTLLPYLYDALREGEQTGLPVMRPLVLEFQDDPAVTDINDEFLCGSALLVAPVVQQGQRARSVYLPKGANWIDFWTNETFAGGQNILRDAPLDLCPIYVKEGSILPRWPVRQYVGEQAADTLILDVCLPAPGEEVSCTHFTDDGETFAYREGGYNRYEAIVRPDGPGAAVLRVKKTHAGYGNGYRTLHIRCVGKPAAILTSAGKAASPGEAVACPFETDTVELLLRY